jgi:hypothetical protein
MPFWVDTDVVEGEGECGSVEVVEVVEAGAIVVAGADADVVLAAASLRALEPEHPAPNVIEVATSAMIARLPERTLSGCPPE